VFAAALGTQAAEHPGRQCSRTSLPFGSAMSRTLTMLYESVLGELEYRMDYKEILKILAPCGLNCVKCIGYANGPVREHSSKLSTLLEGIEPFTERFSSFVPAFKKYSSFEEVLEVFAEADCVGCRDNEAKHALCSIARCYKDKENDFCFQCEEYPCNPEGIDPDLLRRWIKMNDRMKEIGVEAYYEETKDEPRYKQLA
jgi:hypothetical protein